MKWFKHDSNASLDAKLQRLRLKYGMEGYGLYWYCLECVSRNVDTHNLTFELEEDAELIAAATNIHADRVSDMMVFMSDLGLFENTSGQITCLKMATRTDEYTQKLIRTTDNVQRLSRQCPDKVPPNRIEENRIDIYAESDKPTNKKKRFKPPTQKEVQDYFNEKGFNLKSAEQFVLFYESKGWMVGKNKMQKWKAAASRWSDSKTAPASSRRIL